MVERDVDAPPISFRYSGGRVPDGHVVPHAPRHLPPVEQPPPVTYAERWWAVVFVGLVAAAIVVGVLR